MSPARVTSHLQRLTAFRPSGPVVRRGRRKSYSHSERQEGPLLGHPRRFCAAACTNVRFRRCITTQCYHAEGLRCAANTNNRCTGQGPLSPQVSHSSVGIQQFLVNGRFGEIARLLLHPQQMAAVRPSRRILRLSQRSGKGSKQSSGPLTISRKSCTRPMTAFHKRSFLTQRHLCGPARRHYTVVIRPNFEELNCSFVRMSFLFNVHTCNDRFEPDAPIHTGAIWNWESYRA